MARGNKDLQMTADGRWEPFEVLAGVPDGADIESSLREQGWEPFLTLGSSERIGISVEVWMRHREDGQQQYLLDVWSEHLGAPFLKVDGLPTLMELLAKWAPIVQAASISRVVTDLSDGVIEHEGLVETVAARAAWGVQERMPEMKRYRDQWDADRRTRRQGR